MTAVVGEDLVRAAYRRGQRKIVADPRDIVTPQALDAIDRLGMRLLRAPTTPSPPLGSSPGRALSRTLYRRHPGFVPSARPRNVRATKLQRVAILGSGGIGSVLASTLASSASAAEVVLIDLIPGLAEAVAVDIEQAASMTATGTLVSGTADIGELAAADVVVLAPEAGGLPGRTAALVGEVQMAAEAIATHAPDAVVIFSGWPSEVFTGELLRSGNLAPERVLGTGATLASSRLIEALAAHSSAPREEIEALALGADGAYVPILSASRVRGRLVRDALRPAEVGAAVAAAAAAPSYVQSLRPSRPPSFAPAYAALEVINAVRGARPGPIPVSVMSEGSYGIGGAVVGVTAHLTVQGLRNIVELPLEKGELGALRDAANGVLRQSQELAELST